MKPYYEHGGITLYHGDCREILPQLGGGADLVLSDPPYGSGLSTAFNDRFTHKAGKWWKNTDRSTTNRHAPIAGDDKPFDLAHILALATKTILWGGNWFGSRLPDSGGWLVWDKRHKIEHAEWPMSEAELAWTNIGNAVRVYRHMWFGLLRESEKGEHFHPTQKPVSLMAWCILQAKIAPKALVIDPYCGSGPVLSAAKALGHPAIGMELEEKYCEIAAVRLGQEVFDFSEAAQ